MASGEDLSKRMQKARRKLAALIQTNPEWILLAMDSHLLLTQQEYFFLSEIKDPKELVESLINTILQKTMPWQEIFLHCLEELRHEFPNLQPISEYLADEKGDALKDILSKLKLEEQKSEKLSLQEVLEISSEGLKQCAPQRLEDLPWHFLRKVLALNVTARNTGLEQRGVKDLKEKGIAEETTFESLFFSGNTNESISLNPLDVLCAVLLCSDSFLQQEILSKMSLCQFALPLLLPPLESPTCTLMLWAMRDIVKKWRPHSMAESRGFREESLVVASMLTISFVRMGNLSFSKSKFLNEFLSPSQQHHNYFMHQDMEYGDIPRKIADGLVEMAWYFPGGEENSDLFPEPVAVANLRGDIESHRMQFSFLTQVSSAVFVFAKHIGEHECNVLSSLKGSATQYFLILEDRCRESSQSMGFLKKVVAELNLKPSDILLKNATRNQAEFVKKLRSIVGRIINAPFKCSSIKEMADVAHKLSIQADEDCQECQNALQCAEQITKEIKDVVKYKEETLKLQGVLWKKLAETQRELCRMKKQGDKTLEKYRSELIARISELREKQNQCDLPISFMNFIISIKQLNFLEKHYFLKWMKFKLDRITRANRVTLWDEYKEKSRASGDDGQNITEVDQKIISSSLGIEHFMRELGQFYEAEYSMAKGSQIKSQFNNFPGIVADLMLEGFPLELIDGDASNIPLQWITAVLTELNNKVRGQSKMFVITVLGVQSTGKSTLLNTMFGLQFPVSCGRCTRGAFMTLLKVRENLAKELGCDFILLIDTEGLKAPEMAKVEGSYQHDNELSTLVIGLSDITIVNMAMENATEMKDILQIVAHAFLRMERIGQKPHCQFVHQNVSDVCAHDQNMRDRKRLLEQLNEMTQAAAKMEKLDGNIRFTDIMGYDPRIHNWYIPGLWHGVPPMAPVNRGYSEKVFELKKHLFEFIRDHLGKHSAKDIPQFIGWVKSLWNAVKHENFIFSFQNSLIAEAYINLSVKYSEWDWDFRREMHHWISEQKTLIENITPDKLNHYYRQNELQNKLSCEEKQLLEKLDKYFESGATNLHLIEKYREDFVRSANTLKCEMENYSHSKLQDTIRIKNGQQKIELLQTEYLKTIERKVDRLLEVCRQKDCRLEDEELEQEFERMWNETLSEMQTVQLEKHQIYKNIEQHLRKDLNVRARQIPAKFQEGKGLLTFRISNFQVEDGHIHSHWLPFVHLVVKNESVHKVEQLSHSLMEECIAYIDEKVNSKGDYSETFCCELLQKINRKLEPGKVKKLHITPSFEVDLKIHILGEAANEFQKMHEKFIKENDPKRHLEKLKPQYLSTFKDLYQKKDAQQIRAKNFCDQVLHPGLEDYINKKLGIEIVNNFLQSKHSIRYSNRSFFQFTVLQDLLEEMNFDSYVKYINSYEQFVKSWIWEQMSNYYAPTKVLKTLEETILSAIVAKVEDTLNILKNKNAPTFSRFLDDVCLELQKDLVISKKSLVGLEFKNAFNPGLFTDFVKEFLPALQKQILSKFDGMDIQSKLSKLSLKPQDEIFKRVFGCGKQCPFCKVPCEAGGIDHQEHFATIHRPKGLGEYRNMVSEKLVYDICSSAVASDIKFQNLDTDWKPHPYKDYHVYYPDWKIQPDPSINASDYWKFIFKEFQQEFATLYKAKVADLPNAWKNITKEQALKALQKTYNMQQAVSFQEPPKISEP